MNKKTIYLGAIIIIIIIAGVILFTSRVTSQKKGGTASTSIPDNMAISQELGGSNGTSPSEVTNAGVGAIRGSCYIKADSQCIDYIGTAFSSSRIKTVCSNDEAIISTNPCPAEAKVGGCHVLAGTEMDMISWSYSNGDKPITGDVLSFTKTLCNGMEKSSWIEAK
ncbi:MAG: hypothetical protein WCV68_02705 [Candidatus Paceibacterota bacterium]|jgi:hypothetical protein